METLVRAASDFLAAILARVGVVGRPRRRAAIRQDLELLRDLEATPELGRDTWAHQVLIGHIALEVAKYSGVELPRRRIPWGSVIFAALIGGPLGYLTYSINDDGFRWYSLFPGLIAGLMAIAILGMIFASDEEAPEAVEGTQAEAEDTTSDLTGGPGLEPG
ncbi:MAG: hypothetical protein ACJ76L_11770 [Conexibacter sp.]